ncbi:MAG: hypothetical protein ABEJ03_04515 [Candidatus Nanohaloarchaea archaeon]
MTSYSDAEMARALAGTPARNYLNRMKFWRDTEQLLEDSYEESLKDADPDMLMVHGSNASLENPDEAEEEEIRNEYEKIERRIDVMKQDLENLDNVEDTEVLMFEDEYEVLEKAGDCLEVEGIDGIKETYGVNFTDKDADPSSTYEELKTASEEEDVEEIRTYTSSGQREKVQHIAERNTDLDVTTFGTPRFSARDTGRHYMINKWDKRVQTNSLLRSGRNLFSRGFGIL